MKALKIDQSIPIDLLVTPVLEDPWTSKRQVGSRERVREWRLALRAAWKYSEPFRQRAPQPWPVGHLHLCLFEGSLFGPSSRGSPPLTMNTLKSVL